MKRIILIALTVFSFMAVPISFAQNSIEEQQKKFQEVLGKITWKNLAIDFYDVKDRADKGYKPMVVKSVDDKSGMTFYVAKNPIFGLQDTHSMDVSYSPGDGDTLRLMIRFNPVGKKALFDYTSAHLNQMMGVVIDGKLRLVATLRQPLSNGRVQIYGFDSAEAIGILKRYYQPKIDAANKFNQQLTAMPTAQK